MIYYSIGYALVWLLVFIIRIRLNIKAYGSFRFKYLFVKQSELAIYNKYYNLDDNQIKLIVRYNKNIIIINFFTILFIVLIIATLKTMQ